MSIATVLRGDSEHARAGEAHPIQHWRKERDSMPVQTQCERCSQPFAPVFHEDADCPQMGDVFEATPQMTWGTQEIKPAPVTPKPQPVQVPSAKPQANAPTTAQAQTGLLETMLIEALKPQLASLIDWNSVDARIAEIAQREARSVAPITFEVRTPAGDTKNVGVQHAQFGKLLAMLSQRVNVWLYGEAGSGKTSAASAVAEALGLAYHAMSVGPTTASYDILGYHNASGDFVPGAAYAPYKHGGVFLIDEIDSASADSLIAINQVLANGRAVFGTEIVERHPDFVVIAAANTFGTGRDAQYVGRSQLDGATLDRFTFLRWDCDAGIERAIVDGFKAQDSKRAGEVERWYALVQDVRRAINATGVQTTASTRAIIDGAKLIVGCGFSVSETAEARFWARLTNDDAIKIQTNMKGGK